MKLAQTVAHAASEIFRLTGKRSTAIRVHPDTLSAVKEESPEQAEIRIAGLKVIEDRTCPPGQFCFCND